MVDLNDKHPLHGWFRAIELGGDYKGVWVVNDVNENTMYVVPGEKRFWRGTEEAAEHLAGQLGKMCPNPPEELHPSQRYRLLAEKRRRAEEASRINKIRFKASQFKRCECGVMYKEGGEHRC